ncbi:MAG TPA: hypothetical protein VM283_07620, partial [Armatimonadota bacterium]|nr:hypothetical protein [Armatimonadota bacterium]
MRLIPMVVLMLCAAAAMAAPVTIVENGQAKAVIVLPADAPAQLAAAASEMQGCIAEASGATLEIADAPAEGMVAVN